VNRCIDHSMHCAAYHFIKSLHIPSLTKTKRTLQAITEDDDDAEDPDDGDDESGSDVESDED